MTGQSASTTLLADAVRYALGSVARVKPGMLACPTPCTAWDLAALLEHVNDSLAALYEGITGGHIGLYPSTQPGAPVGNSTDERLATFRDRAIHLVTASATAADQDIAIAGQRLPTSMVTAVGAVEIAVHGWDIAEACGTPRPIPPILASGILDIIPLAITDGTRHGRFAAPVPLSPLASPSDHVIGMTGRNPHLL